MEQASNTQRAHTALFVMYAGLAGLCVWGLGAERAAPVLVLLGAMGALHLAVSMGAGAQKDWARVISLGMGYLMLVGFPIGTIIGLHLIANAKTDWRLERPRYSGSLTDGWPVRGEAEGA